MSKVPGSKWKSSISSLSEKAPTRKSKKAMREHAKHLEQGFKQLVVFKDSKQPIDR